MVLQGCYGGGRASVRSFASAAEPTDLGRNQCSRYVSTNVVCPLTAVAAQRKISR